MNDGLLNAVIAASASVLVAILSHILIRQKEKAQVLSLFLKEGDSITENLCITIKTLCIFP